LRCAICARPLLMQPVIKSTQATQQAQGGNAAPPSSPYRADMSRLGLDGQIWGNQALTSSLSSVVMFSNNKLSAHKYCLDNWRLATGAAGGATGGVGTGVGVGGLDGTAVDML
jgi:hypothetical protein